MYQEDALYGRENCVLILIDVFFTAFVKLVFSFFCFFFPSLQVCRLLKSVESKISNVHLPVFFTLDGRGVRGRDGWTVCLEKPTTRRPSCHNSYCQNWKLWKSPQNKRNTLAPQPTSDSILPLRQSRSQLCGQRCRSSSPSGGARLQVRCHVMFGTTSYRPLKKSGLAGICTRLVSLYL